MIMSNVEVRERGLSVELAFIGMGSIGMLYASRLLSTGKVKGWTITQREAQAHALKEHGLTVMERDGGTTTICCSAQTMETWDGRADWGLIFVKQTHLPALIRQLQQKPYQPCRFLLFQNGLGHAEKVAAAFPGKSVYVAVTTEGAMRQEDWLVRHTGKGMTWLGNPFAERDDMGRLMDGLSECVPIDRTGWNQLQQLASLLQNRGMNVEITSEIRLRMWEKWVINCAVNPITGILSIPNGAIPASKELRQLVGEVVQEAIEVARAHGIVLDANLGMRVFEVCEKTAENTSSMLQDLIKKKETEIDALNGLLLGLAEEKGLNAPVNRVLYQLLKAVENTGFSISESDHD